MVTNIKTQMFEAVMRDGDYEDTVKMLLLHELRNFKPKGDDYDKAIKFKPTTHRAKSF